MKREIIAHMREKTGMTAHDADFALAAAVEAISTVANRDGSARVPGFGTFKVKNRAARTGRNPRTGEAVQIAASRALTFKEAKGG
jgi:nucleoid DNA-binding protein